MNPREKHSESKLSRTPRHHRYSHSTETERKVRGEERTSKEKREEKRSRGVQIREEERRQGEKRREDTIQPVDATQPVMWLCWLTIKKINIKNQDQSDCLHDSVLDTAVQWDQNPDQWILQTCSWITIDFQWFCLIIFKNLVLANHRDLCLLWLFQLNHISEAQIISY